MVIVDRRLFWTHVGAELSADPRHAENVIRSRGFTKNSKGLNFSGKEPRSDGERH